MDAIRAQVVDSLHGYRAGVVTLAAAEAQVRAAEVGYAARAEGHGVGVVDATELLTTELEVQRARLAWVSAGVGLRRAQVRWQRVQGEAFWR